MKLRNPSLLRRMLIGQMIGVVGFCLMATGNLLWQFNKQGEGEIDKSLLISAQAIANTLKLQAANQQEAVVILASLDAITRESTALYKKEQIAAHGPIIYGLRVSTLQGQELYRSAGYPVNFPADASQATINFNNSGQEWRGAILRVPDQNLVIQIAQTTASVEGEITELIKTFILWPTLWFLPFATLVTYFIVRRGLKPVNELAQTISQRSPSDMQPLVNTMGYIEINPVVNEINSLLNKLDDTLRRERNFLADAAHELRTPLAVVQAQAHILEHASTAAEKSAAVDELNLGIERAASLIQKLLLTAKVSVDTYSPKFEKINLTAFVQERIASLMVLAARKNIDIELHAPHDSWVHIDTESFMSAVDNVLDNAIRYTPVAGQISVHIEKVVENKLCLRIMDNGVGIAPHLQTRVFERFFRIAGTEQQGSGLGLSIVKRVLSLHGGDVSLSTGLEQRGLSVALTLPSSS
jgi:signal transduction histidine kinase